MKTIKLVSAIILFILQVIYANGVAIKDASTGKWLVLVGSSIDVTVKGQISITKITNTFHNQYDSSSITFSYPLMEQASATSLRYSIDGNWYSTNITGKPTDPNLPGGTVLQNLKTYLGQTPMNFGIPQKIPQNSTLVVELTYVELLPYKYGKVKYSCINDYHLLQTQTLEIQKFSFNLTSQRNIDSLFVTSQYPVTQQSNYGTTAHVEISYNAQVATSNYAVEYVLNASQLGLFGYSTYVPQNQVPDSLQRGYFSFIAEPDPTSVTQAIKKNFILIVDRSGSMDGTKMEQAKNAASYIVKNLNEGDRFNLIDFDDVITGFRAGLVNYTTAARDSALVYIQNLYARNNTSISGAFASAVPQFSSATDSSANIVIFLTDGQPTAGITATDQLVTYIQQQVTLVGKPIYIYNFGIGADVNVQLLTLIASKNKGFATMLGNDELYTVVTDFYNTVRNPVLLSPVITFNPPLSTTAYPDSLPNMYKGTQLILAGRYTNPGPMQITFSGNAFGHQVSYQYQLNLLDSANIENQFLLKIWAKRKIESLLVKYNSLLPTSSQAVELKNTIISISTHYGILTQFTSFTGGTSVEDRPGKKPIKGAENFQIVGNYPNPFNPSTAIQVRVQKFTGPVLEVKIYSITGELIKVIQLAVHGEGLYTIKWDGKNSVGAEVPSGTYIYTVTYGDQISSAKMMLMK
ncbi:MAG: VWA domain-containing protein [Ignavibacteria bacterium]|nr:VWA domain-containing protein [Ignavibacteria bacterium]